MQRVVIVDYGSGNLHSAAKAVERAAGEGGIAAKVLVSARPSDLAAADRVILPGVGAFGDCRAGLEAIDGLIGALEEAVVAKARPFLGICVGMQLMATVGKEFGETPGFGWIGGRVDAITPSDPGLKIPHMGWNTLDVVRSHALLAGISAGREGQHGYFVHSYQFIADDPAAVIATTDYGGPVVAMVGRDNLVGTQFHPEKSQHLGLRLLANFLAWSP